MDQMLVFLLRQTDLKIDGLGGFEPPTSGLEARRRHVNCITYALLMQGESTSKAAGSINWLMEYPWRRVLL